MVHLENQLEASLDKIKSQRVSSLVWLKYSSKIFPLVKYTILLAAPRACLADVADELFVKYFKQLDKEDILSDCGARFTRRFWTSLLYALGSSP